MIEAKGLTKYYGPFIAIENISFSIREGQIVAFLGPNGAGKTTTMKMLTGFLAPSAGAAQIAGLDIHRERIEASKRLGYLPENGPLYPDMTPLELLEFFGEARELPPAKLKERIAAVRELCALEQVMEKPIGKLSRGMRQRVGLAQALLHDPEVLVMDEPTAGLDPESDSSLPREHQEARPKQDHPDLDAHSPGSGRDRGLRPLRPQRKAGVRGNAGGAEGERLSRGPLLPPDSG